MMCRAANPGWPAGYGGVMLQGFSWDSYSDTRWTNLESMADDFDGTFDLLWIPNAGNCGSGNQMGYGPVMWFPVGDNYTSSFGNLSQLRSLVSTMRNHNIGIIGDVVINHRCNMSNWVDFYPETYNGVTYQLKSTDICRDDDGGATASANPSAQLGNADTGEDWNGIRDLDHTSANVQTNVKAYVKMLLDDLGYVGFRYDMVAGYGATYTGIYNSYANPTYSVGECWRSSADIKSWIDGTKVNGTPTSAAFDFQFRYTVRNAINNNNWQKLSQQNDGNWPLVSNSFQSGSYKQYAVTFVENHDMQDRGNVTNYTKDPIVRDTLAANAYLLAMPGTPCVFLPHWKSYKDEIKNMIAARKAAGITNTSTYTVTSSAQQQFVTTTTGSKTNLICAVGNNVSSYNGPSNTKAVLSGYHYKYFMPTSANIAWLSKPSGKYSSSFSVTATAISSSYNTIVYTTDGSAPTASSARVSSDGTITVDKSMTLRAALLNGNSVVSGSEVTRTYTITNASSSNTVTVYLKDPSTTVSSWTKVYFFAWETNGAVITNAWNGNEAQGTTIVNGEKYYYYAFDRTGTTTPFNVVFNDGSSTQTVDLTGIDHDVYYRLDNATDASGHYYALEAGEKSATIYFKDPRTTTSTWSDVYFYCWDSSDAQLSNGWPGNKVTSTTTVNGDTYYYHRFVYDASKTINLVFTHGSNGPQSKDVLNIDGDAYFKLDTKDATDGKWSIQNAFLFSVYFKQPESEWDNVRFHAWTDENNSVTNADGTKIADTWPNTGQTNSFKYIDGQPWCYRSFLTNANGATVSVVAHNGEGKQTKDCTGLKSDTYITLGDIATDGKYNYVDAGDMTEEITGIELEYHEFRLGVHATLPLQATVSGTNVSSPVVWTSSNEDLVTVTQGDIKPIPTPTANGPQRSALVDGMMYGAAVNTGSKGGTAIVTASIGDYSDECSVFVDVTTGRVEIINDKPLVSIEGKKIVINSPVDGTAQLITPDGRARMVEVKAGINTYEFDGAISIVKLNDKVYKLRK